MAQDTLRFALAAALLAAAIVAAGQANAAQPQEGRPGEEEERAAASGYVERLEVRLVLLQATVLDRKGETVPGLTPADFRLREEGVEQTISVFGSSQDRALRVAFLLDVSGSMALRGKLARAKAAIREFTRRLHSEDQIALLIFADGDVVVKKGFTTDRRAFFAALDPIEAWGQTALRDALASATTIISGAGRDRGALVLLTDGVDNASEMTTFEALRMARGVPVPMYAIAMTDLPLETRRYRPPQVEGRTFFEVLGDFGSETGGGLLPVFSDEELGKAVALVEARLRGQYVIGYKPTSGSDAPGFRRITLETSDPGHRVLTREGYFGGG